jgi:YYY domain-containing protein
MTERVPSEPHRLEASPSAPTWGGVRQALGQLARRLAVYGRRIAASTRDRVLVWEWLALIVVLGAALRFTGLDWDAGQHLHPDERFLTMVENSLQWPSSLGQYWDTAQNPLNPYNYEHGTYVYGLSPVVLAKFLGQVTGYTGYDGVYLAGRAMSATMDLLCVVLAFAIGRRLYGPRVGLLSALLLALSVLSIQQSHYFTVDTTTTFFVTLALYAAVRVAQGEGRGSIILLGVAFGLAVSAKISVASFCGVIALAYLLRTLTLWRRGAEEASGGRVVDASGRVGRLRVSLTVDADAACPPPSPAERFALLFVRTSLSTVVVVLLAVLVFRIVQPQAFTGPGFLGLRLNPQWKDDMAGIARLMSGETDYPPSHQWTNRAPVLYMLTNLVLWGQGLPLGLAVWAGWGLMAWEIWRRQRWHHLLLWAWMSFTFFYQSIQFVKPMRYLLPIYPTMAIVAAYGLVALWDRAPRAGRRSVIPAAMRRLVAGALVALVVVGTAIWAVAFTGIYTRPVTRVTASRWIYQHIPRGSAITFEYWDDPLPLPMDGLWPPNEYRQIQMELYWEDVPEKRDKLYEWLEQADYIILSSNRLYGSIPRLPDRYPMTTRYYEALFSGALGFDHLITFTSRPTFLGIEFVDDNADESFTVYDHPKVTIYKKSADFSMERVRALFDGYDLDRVVRMRPVQVKDAPNRLMLSESAWAAQRAGGTWSELFDRASLANRAPTLVWLGIIYLLGAATFPLVFVALQRLRDRGYLLAKTLGVLLLGYLAWLLPSVGLATYSRATIALLLLAIGIGGGVVAWYQRGALRVFLRGHWRLLLANEALFLTAFLLFWLIRWQNPDLWHPVMGGEKPMDLAYLNAIVRSSSFPPYDPWFAGGCINYYYFGLSTVATLVKLTGIVPTVAYNLAVPTFFALTAGGAACVVYNLVPVATDAAERRGLPRHAQRRAFGYALLGALMVAVLGNLGELVLLLRGFEELGRVVSIESNIPGLSYAVRCVAGLWRFAFAGQRLPFRPEWWYWNATRVMSHGEINEFPFFTFLYADLHAHLTALPYTLLALGAALGLALPGCCLSEGPRDVEQVVAAGWRGHFATARRWAGRVVRWPLPGLVLLALALGALWCSNTWDLPTYLGIGVAAVAMGAYHTTARGRRPRLDRALLERVAIAVGVVIALTVLLYRPFHTHFGSAYSSVALWKGERSPLGALLIIWATPGYLVASALWVATFGRGARGAIARALRIYWAPRGGRERAVALYDLLVRCQGLGYEAGMLGLMVLSGLLLAALLAGAWAVLLGLPLLVMAVALMITRDIAPERRFAALLIAVGAGALIGVEYVVIKGDIGRMNTVFKFYLQIWVLWGIAGVAGLADVWPRHFQWRRGRRLWRTLLVGLLAASALYPLCAAPAKVRDRWDPTQGPGLDGAAYMSTARYLDNNAEIVLEDDRRAIEWLQEHVVGTPVIAEASVPPYRWGSRIATYTGLPTIVGWDWHQKQQRAALSSEVVDWRLLDLRNLYNVRDTAYAEEILRRYQVGYIYVGALERAYYDAEGLHKFDAMVGSTLEIAYRDDGVTIYRVLGSGAREVDAARAPSPLAAIGEWIARHWVPPTVHAQAPVPPARPGERVRAPTPEPLMLDGPVEALPVVDNRGWNAVAMGSAVAAVAAWWAALLLLGAVAWPLVATALPHWADGGYGLAKGLGLLLAAYPLWLGASLRVLPNRAPVAWGLVLALTVGAVALWRRRPALSATWRRCRRVILREEGLFGLAFVAFLTLRLLNPDLWQPWFGGEKMMEMAILNAVTKSAHMPPYDAYFAGGYLNYYYYGYFLTGVLCKLVGVAPEVAFNLAIPTFAALTAVGAFAVAHHLAPRRAGWAGAIAVLLLMGIGNLSGIVQIVEHLAQVGGGTLAEASWWAGARAVIAGLGRVLTGRGAMPPFEYWYYATRIVPNTINEFPFFSFLFADLHPHMMNLPFTVVAAGLVVGLVAGGRAGTPERGALGGALHAALLTLSVGALGVINTWDLPAYLAVAAVVLVYRGARAAGAGAAWRGALGGTAQALALALGALLLYAPFYAHYRAQSLGVGLVAPAERSPLADMAMIWGLFAFLVATLLVTWRLPRRTPRSEEAAANDAAAQDADALEMEPRDAMPRIAPALVGGAGLAGIAGAVSWGAAAAPRALPASGTWTLALLATSAFVACVQWLASWGDPRLFVGRTLLFAGLAILAGIEVFYLRDFLDGSEWRRMNTVFKFSLQAWVLLSLVAGAALPALWRRVAAWGRAAALLWRGALIALLVGALVYPVMAVPVRVNERFGAGGPRWTLDGTAYMREAQYAWPDAEHVIALAYDREAIAWLWDNVPGTPVIAEAPLGFYREGGLRVSSYTGLPTLVGAHQREQRPWQQVGPRERDAEALYTTTDPEALMELVRRHSVRYVYVGQLERIAYGEGGAQTLAALAQAGRLVRVYHNDRVDIYEVPVEAGA